MDQFGLSMKDILIVGLLLMNIGLMIYMCCINTNIIKGLNTRSKVKYAKVSVLSD